MFKKIDRKENSFFINDNKPFSGVPVPSNFVQLVYEFAYSMTYGRVGEHRGYRSGGQYVRKKGEIFCNTFQGKLAEYVVYQLLKNENLIVSPPENTAWKLGKWDDLDLNCNNYKISIKSAAFFSNLLLLETKDWDVNGAYIPNKTIYDFSVLVRLKPDIKYLFRKKGLLYSNRIQKKDINNIILNETFFADIPGFISNNGLKKIISEKFILPRNVLLNGKTKMDASNYYVQAGSLSPVNELIRVLKEGK